LENSEYRKKSRAPLTVSVRSNLNFHNSDPTIIVLQEVLDFVANYLDFWSKRTKPRISWRPARLKALRFHLLCVAGRVIEHGQKLFLKIAKHHPSFALYKEAREKLSLFSSA